jgi:hypothetical protein
MHNDGDMANKKKKKTSEGGKGEEDKMKRPQEREGQKGARAYMGQGGPVGREEAESEG